MTELACLHRAMFNARLCTDALDKAVALRAVRYYLKSRDRELAALAQRFIDRIAKPKRNRP